MLGIKLKQKKKKKLQLHSLFCFYLISENVRTKKKGFTTRLSISFSTSRGARDSKIGKKWPESSRILDYITS